jgi:hypothetical protein
VPRARAESWEPAQVKMTRKVTQVFLAQHTASRRREKFGVGELLTLLDNTENPGYCTFMRVVGIRASGGRECQYSIESEELNAKTEMAR